MFVACCGGDPSDFVHCAADAVECLRFAIGRSNVVPLQNSIDPGEVQAHGEIQKAAVVNGLHHYCFRKAAQDTYGDAKSSLIEGNLFALSHTHCSSHTMSASSSLLRQRVILRISSQLMAQSAGRMNHDGSWPGRTFEWGHEASRKTYINC
jgi:hypothetical protein